jgi:hypothetical protein
LLVLQEQQRSKETIKKNNNIKKGGILPHTLPDDYLMYNIKMTNKEEVMRRKDLDYAMDLQNKEYNSEERVTKKKENSMETNDKTSYNRGQSKTFRTGNLQKREDEYSSSSDEEESFTEKLSKLSEYAKQKLKSFQLSYLTKDSSKQE